MVVARPQVSWLKPGGYCEAVALFDREFIHARGRSISFAQRFSDVFGGDCHVAAVMIAGQIAAALVVHPFTWIAGNREWRGAMIGLVCTEPEHRGNGYAAQLLTAAEQRCRELGHDFAVLWAADQRLYTRLGWVAADRGALGKARMAAGDAPSEAADAGGAALDAVHALHERQGAGRVKRTSAGYRRLPPPADRNLLFLEGHCFAVVGEHEHTGYVYDLGADAPGMPRLWDKLSRRFRELYVNVEQDCAAQRWLRQHTALEWTRQSLAMWKPLRTQAASVERWYIPFLDRI